MKLGDDVWKPEKDPEFSQKSVEISKELKHIYKRIAERKGVKFLAASDIVSPSDIDNEHMDEESHRIFAEAVYQNLSI